DGHAALGQTIGVVVHHEAHGAHDIVEIQQWFAHAHHHHVGDGTGLVAGETTQLAVRQPDLADDLGSGQIAVEALLAGCTEAAVEAAAGLRGHAERAATSFGNVDHLHAAAAFNRDDPLVAAVGCIEDITDDGRADFG